MLIDLLWSTLSKKHEHNFSKRADTVYKTAVPKEQKSLRAGYSNYHSVAASSWSSPKRDTLL